MKTIELNEKEYIEILTGTIIAILCALIYFLSPIDAIIDAIPGIGYFDDSIVVLLCLKLVKSDINEYVNWRDNK